MELVIFWIIMGAVVAIIANSKGLDTTQWFLYGALIWPIALVHVLVAKPNAKVEDQRAVIEGHMRKCPQCAELIRKEAVKCRFCGSQVPAAT